MASQTMEQVGHLAPDLCVVRLQPRRAFEGFERILITPNLEKLSRLVGPALGIFRLQGQQPVVRKQRLLMATKTVQRQRLSMKRLSGIRSHRERVVKRGDRLLAAIERHKYGALPKPTVARLGFQRQYPIIGRECLLEATQFRK